MRCSPLRGDRPAHPRADHVDRHVAGREHREDRLHHVRHRADRRPVRLAEHADADQHEDDREQRSRRRTSQIGKPSESFCTAASTTAQASAPQITHLIGKSPLVSASLPERPWKVFAITFHLRTSAVRPPATMRPVAGHMIHRCRTALNVSSGTSPRAEEPLRRDHPREHHPERHGERHAQPDEHARAERQHAHLGPDAERLRVRREESERERLRDPPERLAHEREARRDRAADPERGDARAGLLRPLVEHEQRLARGGAVREREVLLVDVVLAERHGEQHAEEARGREPGEDLQAP